MVDISVNKRLINSDADSDHSGDLSSSAGGTCQSAGCCQARTKTHPNFVILIAFLAFVVDSMLITVIDPILPDMLRRINMNPGELISDSLISKNQPLEAIQNSTVDLQTENSVQIAVLVGMKPLLETVFNVAAGFLIERAYMMMCFDIGLPLIFFYHIFCIFGYRNPMLVGCLCNMLATLSFGYLRNFYLLLAARVAQAIGGSLSVVGGMVLLSSTFTEERARLRATSIAFAGFPVGLAGGYSLGSILYQLCAPQCPFLVITGLNVIDGVLRICLLPRHNKTEGSDENSGFDGAKSLLMDPLIFAGLAMNFMMKFCIGVYLTTIPAWQLNTLHSQQWNIGVIFGGAAGLMIIVQFLTGRFMTIRTIWRLDFIALLLLALALSLYPLITSTWMVVIPDVIYRVSLGMLEGSLNPMLCHITDVRHNSQYGLINGFYASSYNLALGVGPNVAGGLIKVMPFRWLYWGLSVFMFVFSFTALSWRGIQTKTAEKLPDNEGYKPVS